MPFDLAQGGELVEPFRVSCFGLPWRDGYFLVFVFVKLRMYVAQNELLIIQVWARDFEFIGQAKAQKT